MAETLEHPDNTLLKNSPIGNYIRDAIVIRHVCKNSLNYQLRRGLNILSNTIEDCILFQDVPIELIYYYEKGGYAVDGICNIRNIDGSTAKILKTSTGMELNGLAYFSFTAVNLYGELKHGYIVDGLLFNRRHFPLIENKVLYY